MSRTEREERAKGRQVAGAAHHATQRMKPNLCQPGGRASCGACCGLYNFEDHSRPALSRRLARHAEVLSTLERTRTAFAEAARALRAQLPPPAFHDVRVCPMLGYLDGAAGRVGCLAHPLQNGGLDLRDCGVYSAGVCASFECPSFAWLDAEEAALIRDACPDWYLYGLVVTDVDFVRATFRLLARSLGEEVRAAHFRGEADAVSALGELFALKGQDAAGVFGRFAPPASAQALHQARARVQTALLRIGQALAGR
jgi:hypothetical protein